MARRRMLSMTHLGYILAAYVATALVIGAMIAWVVADLRIQRRKLAVLETSGVRSARRSQ